MLCDPRLAGHWGQALQSGHWHAAANMDSETFCIPVAPHPDPFSYYHPGGNHGGNMALAYHTTSYVILHEFIIIQGLFSEPSHAVPSNITAALTPCRKRIQEEFRHETFVDTDRDISGSR